MNQKSNTPVGVIVVVIVLVVLAVPCVLGAFAVGGWFFYQELEPAPAPPAMIEEEPKAPVP